MRRLNLCLELERIIRTQEDLLLRRRGASFIEVISDERTELERHSRLDSSEPISQHLIR